MLWSAEPPGTSLCDNFILEVSPTAMFIRLKLYIQKGMTSARYGVVSMLF